MIRSARPQSPSAVIVTLFWQVGTDGRTTCAKKVITIGRDCCQLLNQLDINGQILNRILSGVHHGFGVPRDFDNGAPTYFRYFISF